MKPDWPPAPHRSARPHTALVFLLSVCLLLAACTAPSPTPAGPTPPAGTPTPSVTPSITPIPTLTSYPTAARGPGRPFPTPRYTPATPIPDQAAALSLPDEVRVLALLGSPRQQPFLGRTEAIMLVFYHPRLARAAVVSLPPDLFVYIPGFTMQRLSTAYAVGGFETFSQTLEYNFGLRPDEYVYVNADSFTSFLDSLDGLAVTVLESYPEYCSGIPAGVLSMTGEQVLCYVSFREGDDELGRMLRQQAVLEQIFQQVVEGGGLVRVPGLYNLYRGAIRTNLSADDAAGAVPLALRLADPGRIGYFQVAREAIQPWMIPGALEPLVFLPQPEAVREQLQAAVEFASQPQPFTESLLTLEAELTPTPTPPPTPEPPPEETAPPEPAETEEPTEPPAPSPTVPAYPQQSDMTPTVPAYP